LPHITDGCRNAINIAIELRRGHESLSRFSLASGFDRSLGRSLGRFSLKQEFVEAVRFS